MWPFSREGGKRAAGGCCSEAAQWRRGSTLIGVAAGPRADHQLELRSRNIHGEEQKHGNDKK